MGMILSGLAGGSLLASTIAYWPMNLTQGSSSRTVSDSSSSHYDLTVRAEALGGVSFSSNDIGWTLPPNPDADGAASAQYMTSSPGEKDGGNYKQVLTLSSRALCEALGGDKNFTLEGWVRLMAFPASGDKCLFAMNTLGQKSGWAWQFAPTSVSDVYTIKVDFNANGSRATYDLKAGLAASEVTNRWNHFALVRVATKTETTGEWLFYLNGHLRGSNALSPRVTESIPSNWSYSMSGANSAAAQQIVGDMLCWRASDTALAEGEFLCDVPPAGTVGYWPMGPAAVGSGRIVPSATGPSTDWTVRDAALGGLEVVANDVGWSKPVNPDPQADDSAVWTSDKAMRISMGEKKNGSSYQPILTSSSLTLDAALTSTNDFCLEGWYYAEELPSGSSANHMFAFNTYSWYGGWVWNLYGADGSGKCAVKVTQELGKRDGSTGSSRKTYTVGSLDSSAILNKWNHYALVFDARRTLWKFYFNGLLAGAVTGDALTDLPSRNPVLCLFGCSSGTAQIPSGKVTTWRLSRGKFTLARFLCGDMSAANSYTWTGAANTTWSAGTGVNWKDVDGTACAWKNFMGAIFDGAAEVTLSGEVNPSTVTVKGAEDVSIATAASSYIGTACEEIVKEGAGTLRFSGTGQVINKSSNSIHVKGGTLRVSNPNNCYSLGDATKGYEVFVHGGATLAVEQRNALGLSDITTSNRNRFVVYTNGVFDLSCPSGTFNIQTFGRLELEGGLLVPPATGHDGGCLEVRDRVSFGLNPGKTPYVFHRASTSLDKQTWKYGTNTEFAVANITGDDAPDVTFENHLMAIKAWQDATEACCFRKTGDGTMVLGQQRDGYATAHACYPTGPKAVNTVEAGELRVDCDYTGPSFDVASGAFLSGTGTVSAVVLEAGAGLKGTLGARSCLTISGDCTIRGGGVVALRAPDATRNRVKLAAVGGSVVGGANLSSWTVLVDGEPQSEFYVVQRGQTVVAKRDSGLMVIFR